MKRIMIAAMHSGAGKTSMTMGVLRYLREKGIRVRAFKTGPDYIDTSYHTMITGQSAINLDPYFTEPKDDENGIYDQIELYSRDSDICIIEGAMGYHDGIYGQEPRGSAMAVALASDADVCLVCDTDDAGAIAEYTGRFCGSYPQKIDSILLNRCCKEKYGVLRKDIEKRTGIRVIGYLEEDKDIEIPSRHLGLLMPDEQDIEKISGIMMQKLSETADMRYFMPDKDEIRSGTYAEKYNNDDHEKEHTDREDMFTVAIAKDKAFCFMYEDNLTLLREAGARIVYFSPLEDDSIPEGSDLLWLSGGYPEIFANELSKNTKMKESIKRAFQDGMPLIAECGGFMYLHERLEGADRVIYEMVGILNGSSFNNKKLTRFGYIELTSVNDNLLFKKGDSIRSHEFHHWDSEDPGSDLHAVKASGTGEWDCVHATDHMYAGYPHLYLRSNPETVKRLSEKCIEYRDKRAGR